MDEEQLIRHLLRVHDKVIRRRSLLAAGVSRRSIETAWRSGALIRVRNGMYAAPDANAEVVRAVRVGGVLAGSSAAAEIGIWTPHQFPLTVSVPPNAERLRSPDNASRPFADADEVDICTDGHRLDRTSERLIVSPTTVVLQALQKLPAPEALATIDSALHLPRTLRPELSDLSRRVPQRLRPLLDLADPSAEAGTESIVRFHLVSANIPFEPQRWLTSTVRVDFLVAGFLVVECVSRTHHAGTEKYNADRERITRLVTLGYVVLEFTYQQIVFQWESVWSAILVALTQRPHQLPPRSPFCE